ncbi:hypothetical protein TKK_0004947 [Trichogramma kaykai]|uniref:Protein artemis n=1 Tax=Trichogramma kaykai TaxID=54128 RepID=A0ABD2XIY1_9HYME
MSSFCGLVDEIPGISVDCYVEENLNSSVYFLSHFHTDHMKGLNDHFFTHLLNEDKIFYCSSLTKLFLINKYPQLCSNQTKQKLIELELNSPTLVKYKFCNSAYSLMVTSISSGHCPGSLMFLFKYNDLTILYTGDFRINMNDYNKLESLNIRIGHKNFPISIDKIYLDTTFLNLKFKEFPSRKQSVKQLCSFVNNWIQKNPKNIVILEISALIGSEYIYIEISKALNLKVHVKENIYSVYSKIDILKDHITNIGEITPIHACMNKKDSMKNKNIECRPVIDSENILTVVPSAQKWSGKDTSCMISQDENRFNTINICYSTHASYNEIEAFIQYFKPKKVFPCVCEKNEREINDLLDKIMQKKITIDSLSSTSKSIQVSSYSIFSESNYKSRFISDDEDD